MAKNRRNQPKPLSQQTHEKALAERLTFVENFMRLAAQDLTNLTNQANHIGKVITATINVLGPGAVEAEMNRLASPEPGEAPPSEEQLAAAVKATKAFEPNPTDANGSPVEETGGNEAQDRPAESP